MKKHLFASDARRARQTDHVALVLERDDLNVFEDSPSAIVVSIEASEAVEEVIEPGACHIEFTGVIQTDVQVILKMETARKMYATLGELLEETP